MNYIERFFIRQREDRKNYWRQGVRYVMSFVRLQLETNLNTSDTRRQPNLSYHIKEGKEVEGYIEGHIGLDAKFSVFQEDDKNDLALNFLKESARDGILSISISTLERVNDGVEKRGGSITFQISKGVKYHIIRAFVPKADFHFIAAIISASKRRTYVSSGRPVGETLEWLMPFLRTEIRFSLDSRF